MEFKVSVMAEQREALEDTNLNFHSFRAPRPAAEGLTHS